MAEPLKNYFGLDVAERIGDSIAAVHPTFDRAAFVATCGEGFEDLELLARARHISDALAVSLPADRAEALRILVASFGPELENADPADVEPAPAGRQGNGVDNPLAGFFYMPHSFFILDHGGDHFEKAMTANYELTKRFTSESSIRGCLENHTDAALVRLRAWASDPNVHVRRLVSEGTRPRLPWSPRLKKFQADPAPVLALLELLKDDPMEYVRRSVANNLNDIAKDHPNVVIAVANRWWADGNPTRKRLIRHGLRTLIKAGHPGALDVLGYGADSPALISVASITPTRLMIGQKLRVEVELHNPTDRDLGCLADLQVHFVKANGTTSPKVFKGKELALGPGERGTVTKTISVAQHTTRTHYPGIHQVDALINGAARSIGSFELQKAPRPPN